ncbi:uncharacterized protein IAS62_003599 [Cryptococcus decagattii]|uniref:Uncharacterized protein n=1 Tax=Cryptococcus decagattii TaxID=1859122 RepID=A0ABZ2AUZ4_9TREE
MHPANNLPSKSSSISAICHPLSAPSFISITSSRRPAISVNPDHRPNSVRFHSHLTAPPPFGHPSKRPRLRTQVNTIARLSIDSRPPFRSRRPHSSQHCFTRNSVHINGKAVFFQST